MTFDKWFHEERKCGRKPGPQAVWNAALRLGAQPPQATNSASLAIALLERCIEQIPVSDAITALEVRSDVVAFLAAQQQA